MELRDGALVLRPWREEDAPAVCEACQDEEIQRWMPIIPRPYTMEDALAFVRDDIGLGPHQFAVSLDGLVVASVGLRLEQFQKAEVGYWCARPARGRGLVPRAVRLVCSYAFSELGIERMQVTFDPENVASRRVAEKLGFRREGLLRSYMRNPDGTRRDALMYSLLPGEESGAPGRNG
jgi:RimJ/RimL family protein N-acetyltransferase